jgi:hypothetical protein
VLVFFLLKGVNSVPFRQTCSLQSAIEMLDIRHVERLRAGVVLEEGHEQRALQANL